jgi:hypothetical protein
MRGEYPQKQQVGESHLVRDAQSGDQTLAHLQFGLAFENDNRFCWWNFAEHRLEQARFARAGALPTIIPETKKLLMNTTLTCSGGMKSERGRCTGVSIDNVFVIRLEKCVGTLDQRPSLGRAYPSQSGAGRRATRRVIPSASLLPGEFV